MSWFVSQIGRVATKLQRESFIRAEMASMKSSLRRPLNILFSPKDNWEPAIRASFARTGHRVHFEELSPDTISGRDLVVPLKIDDLKYLDGVRDLIPRNPIPVPSLDSVMLCDDKQRFNTFMQESGFGDYVPETGEHVGYPYLVKKRIDEWGSNTHLVRDVSDERALGAMISDPAFFRQRHVGGSHQYATHLLIKGARPVCKLSVRYSFESPYAIQGQDKALFHSLSSSKYLDLFVSILHSIGFEGLCSIDYRMEDGRPQILEINPRFGGSLCPFFFSFLRQLDFDQ